MPKVNDTKNNWLIIKKFLGVPRSVKLSEQAFRECLLEGKTTNVPMNSLVLNKDKEMVRTAIMKRGLSDGCTKIYVHDDKVTCTPLQKDGKLV